MVRERYDDRLREDLKAALTVMPGERHLCNLTWLPTTPTPRPLAIYLYAWDDSDEHHSFRIFLIVGEVCLSGSMSLFLSLSLLSVRFSYLIYS